MQKTFIFRPYLFGTLLGIGLYLIFGFKSACWNSDFFLQNYIGILAFVQLFFLLCKWVFKIDEFYSIHEMSIMNLCIVGAVLFFDVYWGIYFFSGKFLTEQSNDLPSLALLLGDTVAWKLHWSRIVVFNIGLFLLIKKIKGSTSLTAVICGILFFYPILEWVIIVLH